ncbi:MAG: hypothetical protein ACTHOB_02720 [Ginsengibacter sp.]
MFAPSYHAGDAIIGKAIKSGIIATASAKAANESDQDVNEVRLELIL